MIQTPFPLPTDENCYLPLEVREYAELTSDERIEFAIMTLMKEANQDIKYKFNYYKDGSHYAYSVLEADSETPIMVLPLSAFLCVCETYEFYKVDTDYLDNFSTKELSLLEICEFLYSTTRKGTIDNILEEL